MSGVSYSGTEGSNVKSGSCWWIEKVIGVPGLLNKRKLVTI